MEKKGERKPNIMMQRTVLAGHNSCENSPQELRPKRQNPLTKKRSAAADHGVRALTTFPT